MIDKIKSLYNKYNEIVNYVIVGGLTTLVSLVTKYLLLFTILDAKNAFQLQVSVIISWIVAVAFAYVMNRKYVFKSKEKKILKEVSKFVSARILTLLMESAILWFFITYLKMNSNTYVVIWTIASQFIVLVGNYVLSKLFVFKNGETSMNKKIFNKENIFNIILFTLLTVLCYMFPYTHDDWAWGTTLGTDRLEALFENYNGRWLGNILVILLTRSRIARALAISITLTFIVVMIRKNVQFKNKYSKYILISLLLLMPVNIIAQAIAWTSGFTNYVIPFLIVLLIIYLNRNIFLNNEVKISNKWIVPLLISGFACSLFMENMTIYNLILSIVLVGYLIFKKKNIIWSNIAYMIGSIVGTILMFSNGAYYMVANSADAYRTIEQGNIFARVFQTYFDTFYKLFIQNNYIMNIFICVISLVLIYKYMKNAKNIKSYIKVILYIVSTVFVVYTSYIAFLRMGSNSNIFVNEDICKYFEGALSILYFISIFVTVLTCVGDKNIKKRLMFELISILIITGPLLIVTPIGPRCFISTYFMFALFAIDCFDNCVCSESRNFMKIIKLCPIVLMIYFICIYGQVFKIDNQRRRYIKKHKEDTSIVLPLLPYAGYMQGPNPVNDVFEGRFKMFYNINSESKIEFVTYEQWKEITENNKK